MFTNSLCCTQKKNFSFEAVLPIRYFSQPLLLLLYTLLYNYIFKIISLIIVLRYYISQIFSNLLFEILYVHNVLYLNSYSTYNNYFILSVFKLGSPIKDRDCSFIFSITLWALSLYRSSDARNMHPCILPCILNLFCVKEFGNSR